MPRIFVPFAIRPLTRGDSIVEVEGATVRAAIDSLERIHPGVRDRICDDQGNLRIGLAVVIGGSVAPLGIRQRVEPDAEIHLLPAIGGG
jgi:molybdopterin synthase sulfur carrier subunit